MNERLAVSMWASVSMRRAAYVCGVGELLPKVSLLVITQQLPQQLSAVYTCTVAGGDRSV